MQQLVFEAKKDPASFKLLNGAEAVVDKVCTDQLFVANLKQRLELCKLVFDACHDHTQQALRLLSRFRSSQSQMRAIARCKECISCALLVYFVKHSACCAKAVARAGGMQALLMSRYAEENAIGCLAAATAMVSLDNDDVPTPTKYAQLFLDCQGEALVHGVVHSAWTMQELTDVAKCLAVLLSLPLSAKIRAAASEVLWRVIHNRGELDAANTDLHLADRCLLQNTSGELDAATIGLHLAARCLLQGIKTYYSASTDPAYAGIFQGQCWAILHARPLWSPEVILLTFDVLRVTNAECADALLKLLEQEDGKKKEDQKKEDQKKEDDKKQPEAQQIADLQKQLEEARREADVALKAAKEEQRAAEQRNALLEAKLRGLVEKINSEVMST